MSRKTCFFIGNRHTPNAISERLAEVIEKHITEYNVTTFTVGHYGNFDNMVMGIFKKIKKQHADIELYLLLPYAFTQKAKVPEWVAGILYPNGLERGPMRVAIPQANRYMVENSDYLISYCHNVGNTRNIVEYAKKLEKKGLIKITLL